MITKSIVELLKTLYYILITLPRDARGLLTYLKIKRKTRHYETKQSCVADVFQKWVRKQPNKPCIVFNDIVWTYQDLENYSNKIANVFEERFNLKKGDCVALFMENRPEFIGIWYGLSKLGVITALINTNLRLKPLVHSIECAKPKVVIYDEELEKAVAQVKGELTTPDHFIRQGASNSSVSEEMNSAPVLETLLDTTSDLFNPTTKVTGKDVLMYIYTSGTTGLPKPAIIKHSRYIVGGFSFFDATECTTDDVFFVTLPIYHSNGGIIGCGSALISGATVVLRKKFSATNFFKDAVKYKCTVFCYVGEVCRYLLNQPASALDKHHTLRKCIGNGLRYNIHKEFTDRFGIKCNELYGATEGNCILINTVGHPGACGFIPKVNRYLGFMPIFTIRVDSNMQVVRNKQGYCIQCDVGEKGLLVGVISDTPTADYAGYANSADSSRKKIIDNLFYKGQRAFNTGDFVTNDEKGYVYFVDRLGDTFRWRGENVSTVEVENIISSFVDSREVVVYGVEVPGQEGRAGMATIIVDSIDTDKLSEFVKENLPSYAKPLFVRLGHVEHTGTFKAQKSKLVEQGYDVVLFDDKTFYFDQATKKYKPLDRETYEQICRGQVRL